MQTRRQSLGRCVSRLEHREGSVCAADAATDPEFVARIRAGPRDELALADLSPDRHVNDHRSGAACDVAAGDAHAVPRGQCRQTVDETIHKINRRIRGQHQ